MKKNLILLFVSLLISFLAAEFIIQFFSPEAPNKIEKPKTNWAQLPERTWVEYHPQLGWYHEKNKKIVSKTPHFEVTLTTNSVGFRGSREYSKEKNEGVHRILALGDSFFFGFGVEDDEVFTALLEKEIGAEVLNLSVAGYGLDQILMAYREIGAQYQADEVIISIFPEDFWRSTRAFSDGGHAKPYFVLEEDETLTLKNVPTPQKYEMKTNQFPAIIHYSSVEKFLRKSILYREIKRLLVKIGKSLGLVDPDTTVEWRIGRAILEQLVAEIRADGARPLFVLVAPDRWARVNERTSLRKSIHRLAGQLDVGLIDTTSHFYEAIQKNSETDYFIEGDGHWTPRGHAFAAELIVSSGSLSVDTGVGKNGLL